MSQKNNYNNLKLMVNNYAQSKNKKKKRMKKQTKPVYNK